MKCSSVFRWLLKNKSYRNTAVYTIYWWSSVESSQNFSFIFFFFNCFYPCELPVLWLSRNSSQSALSLSKQKSLQYCWKQAGLMWTLSVQRSRGTHSFSQHVTLRWCFSLLECVLKWVTLFVCWHEKTLSWHSKRDIGLSRVVGTGVWVAVTLFTFSLIVCLVMLFVDECLVGWNPWCNVHHATDWMLKTPASK